MSEGGKIAIAYKGNEVSLYRNGKGYYMILVTEELKKALKKGVNTPAVHSHEGSKGQWIDLGILVDESTP